MYDPARPAESAGQHFRERGGVEHERLPDRICIPATAMNGHDWFFVRDGARNARTTGAVKLIDAAVASAMRADLFRSLAADACKGRRWRSSMGERAAWPIPPIRPAWRCSNTTRSRRPGPVWYLSGRASIPVPSAPPKGLIGCGVVGHRHAGGHLRGLGRPRRRAPMAWVSSRSSIGNYRRVSPWTTCPPFRRCSALGKTAAASIDWNQVLGV
jgi:hypothetical protein